MSWLVDIEYDNSFFIPQYDYKKKKNIVDVYDMSPNEASEENQENIF